MSPSTPRPPKTCNAPVDTLVETVVLTIDTTPEKVGAFETENAFTPDNTMFKPAV